MTVSPGTRIKELRNIYGMSQEELGRRVGVQRAAINKYEKGSVENIPLKTVENIAHVFNVSPTYVMGWDDQSSDHLAAEVRVIQGVSRFFGKDAVELLEDYVSLSTRGQKRLLQYATEILGIYQRRV